MTDNFIILFHFFNIAFGLTSLFFYFRRNNDHQSALLNPFIQQALFYNLAVLLTVVLDFLNFYLLAKISDNFIVINLLTLISLANLLISFLWGYSFVKMINKFLGIRTDFRKNPAFKTGTALLILLLGFSYVSSVFKFSPGVFKFTALLFSHIIFAAGLVFSVILYKKSASQQNPDNRKAFKVFGVLFIIFSSLSLFVYIDAYHLRLLPHVLHQFSLNILDLLYNSFSLFWFLKYFASLNNKPVTIELQNDSEEELAARYNISKRELEVIRLVCSGKSNQEIAEILFISLGTVKDHLYKIFKKMGVKNRTQLAKLF